MQEEKLRKVCNDFLLLNEEQQNYILGIMHALVFAKNTSQSEPKKPEPVNSVSDIPNVLH